MTTDVNDLLRKKATLEQRLQDGFVRIGEAETQGRDISAWEAFWMELLTEYDAICDELEERPKP